MNENLFSENSKLCLLALLSTPSLKCHNVIARNCLFVWRFISFYTTAEWVQQRWPGFSRAIQQLQSSMRAFTAWRSINCAKTLPSAEVSNDSIIFVCWVMRKIFFLECYKQSETFLKNGKCFSISTWACFPFKIISTSHFIISSETKGRHRVLLEVEIWRCVRRKSFWNFIVGESLSGKLPGNFLGWNWRERVWFEMIFWDGVSN